MSCTFVPTLLFFIVMAIVQFQISGSPFPETAPNPAAQMSRPNRESGLERFLGLGVVLPYPYFQRPKYRFPVYDRTGRGYLLYGYGGRETFEYTDFNPTDGHH